MQKDWTEDNDLRVVEDHLQYFLKYLFIILYIYRERKCVCVHVHVLTGVGGAQRERQRKNLQADSLLGIEPATGLNLRILRS